MSITTIGLDLAKNIFQACGVTADGDIAFNRPLRRAGLSVQAITGRGFSIGGSNLFLIRKRSIRFSLTGVGLCISFALKLSLPLMKY